MLTDYISRIVFITKEKCVLCVVRAEILNIYYIAFIPKFQCHLYHNLVIHLEINGTAHYINTTKQPETLLKTIMTTILSSICLRGIHIISKTEPFLMA
jgi:hypothetical protein